MDHNTINRQPFYESTWFMWVMLVIFPLAGIFLLWSKNRYSLGSRIALSIASALVWLILIGTIGSMGDSPKLRGQVAELQRQTSSLTGETQRLQEKNDALIGEKSSLQEENASLAAEASRLQEENAALQAPSPASSQVETPPSSVAPLAPVSSAPPAPSKAPPVSSAAPIPSQAPEPAPSKAPAVVPTPSSAPAGSASPTWGEDDATTAPKSTAGTVYWVKNGKSYHSKANCVSLSRSKNIQSGTLEEAIATGHSDPCNNCVK